MLRRTPAGLLFLAVLACGPPAREAARPVPTEGDIAAIESVTARYGQAFQSEDVDGVLALMTDDAIVLVPDKPTLVGKERIRAEIEADLSRLRVERLELFPAEIVVSGDWAYARGRSEASIVVEGETQAIRGKYLWILERQEDGSWLVARDSASGDAPPSPEVPEGGETP